MVDGSILPKKDEQFPLLMVAGAGDGGARNATPANNQWNTTTAIPKRRFLIDRWPEYLSTCWMTFILLGISFLVFYALSMIVIYRHEAYVLLKCNETRPASEVFYHHIVPRGGKFPFSEYTNYLGKVSTEYPHLRFRVYFLIDDSKENVPIALNFYEKLYPNRYSEEFSVHNRREVREFSAKYLNVKITVMYLSRYMAMTPLRFDWKSLPVAYIPFYARIFSVWLKGGVGLDLATSSQMYSTRTQNRYDQRINAILKQHNEGINPEKYAETLKKLKREEENEFMYYFYNMMQKMINDTISLFSKSSLFFDPDDKAGNEPNTLTHPGNLKRCHRVRRDVADQENNATSAPRSDVVNIVTSNKTVINITGGENKENVYHILENNKLNQTNKLNLTIQSNLTNSRVRSNNMNKSRQQPMQPIPISDAGWLNHIFGNKNVEFLTNPFLNKESDNKSDSSQMVFFYDISVVSEPVYSEEPESRRNKKAEQSINNMNNRNDSVLSRYVVIDVEGSYVASTTNKHPFLAHVLSGGCKRLHPKFAIDNALAAHCSMPFRNDLYCSSIYVL